MDLINRRNAPRMDYNGSVDIVVKGRLYKEMTENISETGMFIRSLHPDSYTIFDKLTLSFQMPDAKPVKRIGRIVRKGKNGVGILYLGVNPPTPYQSKPNIEALFNSPATVA